MTKLSTFFTITTPGLASKWAEMYWDTYNFDYDLEKTTHNTILAWALESDADLKAALDADEIKYETFKADVDQMFK